VLKVKMTRSRVISNQSVIWHGSFTLKYSISARYYSKWSPGLLKSTKTHTSLCLVHGRFLWQVQAEVPYCYCSAWISASVARHSVKHTN